VPSQRLIATVQGRVQGVGYRWFVRREAEHLGIVGWVSNRRDGGVEVVAEAEDSDLDTLVARLRKGPMAASVSAVDVVYEPARGGLSSFGVRSGEHRGD
jgi:acylphosphatase